MMGLEWRASSIQAFGVSGTEPERSVTTAVEGLSLGALPEKLFPVVVLCGGFEAVVEAVHRNVLLGAHRISGSRSQWEVVRGSRLWASHNLL